MKKLTLRRKTSDTQKPEQTKAAPVRREKKKAPEYYDLGKLIKYLKQNGYKVRWHKPLSKAIYPQIREVVPASIMSSRRIYEAIGHHVHSIRYLLRMKAGDSRFNIKGEREGKVSKKDEQFAQQQLMKHHGEFMAYKRRMRNKPITSNRPVRRKPNG